MQAADATPLHSHRCMRCHEEFTCKTPEICIAQYDVLPTIITLGPDGRPVLTEHCPRIAPSAAGPEVEQSDLSKIDFTDFPDHP